MTQKSGTSYLTGKLLLASPSMADPRFHRAVIFICAHDENGAMGLMINHSLIGLKLEQLLEQFGVVSDIKLDIEKLNMPVLNGGPVDTARGFFLHSNDFSKKDTICIDDSFCITGTLEALKEIISGDGPSDILFILGYAGWEAGQLEQELGSNSWLVVESDSDLIFKTSTNDKWQLAVEKLGIDPFMLSAQSGRA